MKGNSLVRMRPSSGSPQLRIQQVNQRLDRLSKKRREVIRPVLEHPRDFVLLSIRALASGLGTDPATIVRIVRGLGFSGYRQFQHYLHELSMAFATSLDTMQAAEQDGSLPGHALQAIDQDLRNLQGLRNSLEPARLVALAARMYKARQILVIASDLAEYLAEYFEYQLSILGLPVVSAVSGGRITHLARAATPQHVVLAISFRRALRQTVEGAQLAHRHGAYCVGITDNYLSPLATTCHEVFLASIESTSFTASYAAPIALLNALLATCGEYRREETLRIARELSEDQRLGSRWFTP